ncbi:MAG: NrfD/PsrC family molybdoenzyme membrane anchor subunit [Kiloniellales bacterium]
MLGALAGLVLTAGFVFYNLTQSGHAAYNTNSVGVVWGLPIIVYDYFLLTSTGLTMIASFSLVFGVRAFDPVARRCIWLALSGLVGGVAVLFLELGYPFRALYAVPFNLQTASPLFWKVLLVAAYAVVLLLLLLNIDKIRRGDPVAAAARPLALIAGMLAVAIALVAGSVYGMMAMRPFWFGGEIPVTFLIESLMGAFAFTIFFTYFAYGFEAKRLPAEVRSLFAGTLGIWFAVSIALHFLFHGGRAVTGLWSNAEGLQIWEHLVASPLFHLALWGGIVLPFVLMAVAGLRRNPVLQIVASLLVMAALLVSRYEFIIGGQMVPLFKGSWAPDLLSYAPSLTEWVLLLVGIFLANTVFWFSEWRHRR